MNFPTLIKAVRSKLKRKPRKALRKVIPVKAFADDVTLITNKGAACVCLQHGGVDDECLTDQSREYISDRLMAAHKLFDENDRLYQYAIRRANCSFVYKDTYANPKVQEINDDRHKHLRETAGFGSIAIGVSGTDVVLLQVKSSQWPGSVEMEALRNFPVPANTRRLVHRWRDRQRMPDVREL